MGANLWQDIGGGARCRRRRRSKAWVQKCGRLTVEEQGVEDECINLTEEEQGVGAELWQNDLGGARRGTKKVALLTEKGQGVGAGMR